MKGGGQIPIGDRFGKLVVVDDAGKTDWGERLWLCRCDCGETTTVRGKRLRSGGTRSCGCLINADGHSVTHGGRYTRLYRIWQGMRTRCHNPRSKDFPRYGAAGVFVSDEWRMDFAAFRSWAMRNGYADHLTIDRIDAAKSYMSTNCRWVTAAENSRHSRAVKLSFVAAAEIRRRVHSGETHTSVAKDFGVSRSNVSMICEGKLWVA